MKTLHLLRHAKSSWADPGLADYERGLNKRGRRDAPRMGRALAARLPAMPMQVSPARRARLTLEGLCEGWSGLALQEHCYLDRLYTFSHAELAGCIALASPEQAELFIISHNPALTELINLLCGRPTLDNLPTCGYARLRLGVDAWSELGHGCAELESCLFPRELGDL
jgi:phosphohistidine phosphatase